MYVLNNLYDQSKRYEKREQTNQPSSSWRREKTLILTTEVVYKVRNSSEEKQQMASFGENELYFANLMVYFCFPVHKGACNSE